MFLAAAAPGDLALEQIQLVTNMKGPETLQVLCAGGQGFLSAVLSKKEWRVKRVVKKKRRRDRCVIKIRKRVEFRRWYVVIF